MRVRGGADARFPRPPLCRVKAFRTLLAGSRRGRAAGIARAYFGAVQGARAPADLRGRNLLPRLLACRIARPGHNSRTDRSADRFTVTHPSRSGDGEYARDNRGHRSDPSHPCRLFAQSFEAIRTMNEHVIRDVVIV